MKAKTQKAKGILYGLPLVKFYDENFGAYSDSCYLIGNKDDIDYLSSYTLPGFARPCPMRPRHGFIESRIIKSKNGLHKLLREVKKMDPDGEIILSPKYDKVIYNFIYTENGLLSIGYGNDGATGGKKSISFPVAPHKFSKYIRKKSGLKVKDKVFLEGIYAYDQWHLTQIRGGPKVDTVQDFIPKNIKVKKVVFPKNDLLKWEAEVKKLKHGTVVYGNGHTLASHAAIHCVLNKVPFITSHKPKVGENLKKISTDIKLNRNRFARGVQAGLDLCNNKKYDMEQIFLFAACILHNWNYIRKSPHADWLMGLMSIMLAKISCALIQGELRHSKNSKWDMWRSRNSVYKVSMLSKDKSLYKLHEAFEEFSTGNWETGYGGFAWATCTWYSHKLVNSIININNGKGRYIRDYEMRKLVSVVNKIVNVAHNGGWWLNKITRKCAMDRISDNPGVMAAGMAHLFIESKGLFDKQKAKKLPTGKVIRSKKFGTLSGNITWLFVKRNWDGTIGLSTINEIGSYKTRKISMDEEERDETKKLIGYNKNKIALNLTNSGSFRLPASRRVMNIKKVFKGLV